MTLENEAAQLKRIGQRIKYRRMHKELTQEELADQLGTSRSTLAKYEAGDVDISTTTLTSIASKLMVPITYFFDEEVNPTMPDYIPRPSVTVTMIQPQSDGGSYQIDDIGNHAPITEETAQKLLQALQTLSAHSGPLTLKAPNETESK